MHLAPKIVYRTSYDMFSQVKQRRITVVEPGLQLFWDRRYEPSWVELRTAKQDHLASSPCIATATQVSPLSWAKPIDFKVLRKVLEGRVEQRTFLACIGERVIADGEISANRPGLQGP